MFEPLNNYVREFIVVLLTQSETCCKFYYHITELIEIVHIFSIIIDFCVQTKVFSLWIHLSSWCLRVAAVLMLFCNTFILRLSFTFLFSWMFSKFVFFWPAFDVGTMFRETLCKLFSFMSNTQDWLPSTLCSVNNLSFFTDSLQS